MVGSWSKGLLGSKFYLSKGFGVWEDPISNGEISDGEILSHLVHDASAKIIWVWLSYSAAIVTKP